MVCTLIPIWFGFSKVVNGTVEMQIMFKKKYDFPKIIMLDPKPGGGGGGGALTHFLGKQ